MAMTLRLSGDTQDKLEFISKIMDVPMSKIIEQLLEDKLSDVMSTEEFRVKAQAYLDKMSETFTAILKTIADTGAKGNFEEKKDG